MPKLDNSKSGIVKAAKSIKGAIANRHVKNKLKIANVYKFVGEMQKLLQEKSKIESIKVNEKYTDVYMDYRARLDTLISNKLKPRSLTTGVTASAVLYVSLMYAFAEGSKPIMLPPNVNGAIAALKSIKSGVPGKIKKVEDIISKKNSKRFGRIVDKVITAFKSGNPKYIINIKEDNDTQQPAKQKDDIGPPTTPPPQDKKDDIPPPTTPPPQDRKDDIPPPTTAPPPQDKKDDIPPPTTTPPKSKDDDVKSSQVSKNNHTPPKRPQPKRRSLPLPPKLNKDFSKETFQEINKLDAQYRKSIGRYASDAFVKKAFGVLPPENFESSGLRGFIQETAKRILSKRIGKKEAIDFLVKVLPNQEQTIKKALDELCPPPKTKVQPVAKPPATKTAKPTGQKAEPKPQDKPKTTLELISEHQKEIDAFDKEYIANIKEKMENDKNVIDTLNTKLFTVLAPENTSLYEMLSNHLVTAVEMNHMTKEDAIKFMKKLVPQKGHKLIEEIVNSYESN